MYSNRVTIIGFLGKDSETRTTRNETRDKFLPELRSVAAQIAPFVA